MSEKVRVKYSCECESCGGTGLYVGFAEHDGSAVVCRTCGGTGEDKVDYTYTPFKQRKDKRGIKRVYQVNAGIGIGVGEVNGETFTLEDFGGMPFKEWALGLPFPKGSEMRRFTCPAWWYQTANYEKKPDWKSCNICGSFSNCSSFKSKDECWKRWDKEFGGKK